MLADLKGYNDFVNTAEFSPDGKKIAMVSYDNTARIWDATSGEFLVDLKGHYDFLVSAQFSPVCPEDPSGGKRIITASEDNTTKIWDAITGNLLADLKGHNDIVYFAEFSPDGFSSFGERI